MPNPLPSPPILLPPFPDAVDGLFTGWMCEMKSNGFRKCSIWRTLSQTGNLSTEEEREGCVGGPFLVDLQVALPK